MTGDLLGAVDVYAHQVGLAEQGCWWLRVVAIEGRVGDWAAYAGPRWATVAQVRAWGTKLSPALAATLFPELDAGAYRA
jgi:hypothetical protein